jgi:inosine/xanthosine triphosphatase
LCNLCYYFGRSDHNRKQFQVKNIVVASANPVKVNAVRLGFEQIFPDDTWHVVGQATDSGVRAQPMGDEETLQGAMNRALAAQHTNPAVDYAAGVEGGCTLHADDTMSVFAWIVILDAAGSVGRSKTGAFYLPNEIATLVRKGIELGEADDRVFGQSNSKQQSGSVGLLTGNVITRQSYYTHAVTLALIPFKNPTLTFSTPR